MLKAAPCLGFFLLAAPLLPAAEVHPALLRSVAANPDAEADYIVILKEQADLSSAESLRTKEEKGALVFALLNEVAQRTQPPVQRALTAQGAAVVPFWITNALHVRGPVGTIFSLAARSDVARIDPNPVIVAKLPPTDARAAVPNAVEPGVTLINAPSLWSRGFNGQNIVIGGNDTGYRWSHAALKNKYRGWNGTTADHNYNWHDAIHSGGGICGADASAPCDDDGHGTHTMGTMVGDDGGSNQIGVAPGARWIGCRNMDQGAGTPTTYMECLQWFIAPTNLANANPNPALAPHVINNSWGCPTSEGCAANTLLSSIEAVRAAGIVVVVAAGNAGSGCSTVNDAPAIYAASFTIGATDGSTMATFSSRGPVTLDGSNRLKPNVSAPGRNVRSAVSSSDTAYGSKSGTSMAAPHVAGAVAVLLSAHPSLIGNPTAVQTLFEQSALRLTMAQTCGGVAGTTFPNNTIGWGRIDALAAAGFDDPDGDGFANWQEMLAGTTTSDPNSRLRIISVDHANATTVTATFPSIAGKSYRLERADNLVAPIWTTIGSTVTGTGGVLTLSDVSVSGEKYFYRVAMP